MQRTAHRTHNKTESRADMATWGGNLLAMIGAGAGIAAGVIGMLIAFGYINEDSTAPFNDGMTWLLGGLVVAIVANVFRREHHVLDEDADRRHKADDADVVLGNSLGLILGGLAVACAVIALLVNFEIIREGNVNPFEDALVWFTAGGILAFAALTFRREPHVSDFARMALSARGRNADERTYDEGDLRTAPRVDDDTARGTRR